MSGVARLKPWSARALLKRELERCSARPETANCQPGLFGRACLEKQRRRSDVAWFYNGMASLDNGMFKGRGSVRALLRPTKANGQPGPK